MDNTKKEILELLDEIEEKIKKYNEVFCNNCNNKVYDSKDTLICNCSRRFCTDCWYDANDEYCRWETDGTKRNNKGSLLIDCCDYCLCNDFMIIRNYINNK